MNRNLASVQKIATLNPIDGADKIEVATMENLGWECVVKKGEFKVGDPVVYCEVDSILPEKPAFEFMRERKFRIRTIRLKKQVSQGLILPINVLESRMTGWVQGMDVTELLGIQKYDPQAQDEKTLEESKPKSALVKFLMGFKAFRWIYFKFNKKEKGNWPAWIQKTDEDRIQVCLGKFMRHLDEPWYYTEKVDGSSTTIFTKTTGKLFKKRLFGVCSRNIWLKTPDEGNYWTVVRDNALDKKMSMVKRDLVVQGEVIAPKVQANKYKVNQAKLYLFNVVEDGVRVGLDRFLEIAYMLGVETAPVLGRRFIPSEVWPDVRTVEPQEIVRRLVGMSEGKSKLYDTQREGIVVRLERDPSVSFKVINPSFLLKHGE